MNIEGKEERRGERKQREKRKKDKEIWTEEGRKEFQGRMEERLAREEKIEKEWRGMRDKIKEALEEVGKKKMVKKR